MKQGAGGGSLSDVKVSVMHLTWHIPRDEHFVPWLDEVCEAGYDGITSFSHWGLESFVHRPAELGRLLSDRGLELAAVDCVLHDSFEEYKPVLEFMQALGTSLLVCIDPAGSAKEYGRYASMLNTVGEMAAGYGVDVHYHNHTNSVGETMSDVENLMSRLDPDRVKLMLDVGHATKDFIELPVERRAADFLQRHWDRINYLELKDWNEQTDLNTPLGEGETDFDRIFELMRTRGYAGWVTVEQNGNDGLSRGRSPLACVKISREFLRNKLGV